MKNYPFILTVTDSDTKEIKTELEGELVSGFYAYAKFNKENLFEVNANIHGMITPGFLLGAYEMLVNHTLESLKHSPQGDVSLIDLQLFFMQVKKALDDFTKSQLIPKSTLIN